MTFWDIEVGALFRWTDGTDGVWKKMRSHRAQQEGSTQPWQIGAKGDQEVTQEQEAPK